MRINELHTDFLMPFARKLNVDLIWIHGSSTVLESTLAYSLNSRQTPTLVVEMGVGMRITASYCMQLLEGIFAVMKEMGIWNGPVEPVRSPLIAQEADDVYFLNAPTAGIFISKVEHGSWVQKGDEIGSVVDPLQGRILERMKAPVSGLLFTRREYPVVNEGSLIARILKKDGEWT